MSLQGTKRRSNLKTGSEQTSQFQQEIASLRSQ